MPILWNANRDHRTEKIKHLTEPIDYFSYFVPFILIVFNMQQFQDDIMRAKQLALAIEERLMEKIENLERRVSALENRNAKKDQTNKNK